MTKLHRVRHVFNIFTIFSAPHLNAQQSPFRSFGSCEKVFILQPLLMETLLKFLLPTAVSITETARLVISSFAFCSLYNYGSEILASCLYSQSPGAQLKLSCM